MVAYRHHDHAGNFADLFKHTLLIELLGALRAQGLPLVYLESHAGAGRYTPAARVTRRLEALARTACPAAFARLLAECELRGERPSYPGSPWLAARLLGPRDRLALVEYVAEPRRELEALFVDDARTTCLPGDGFSTTPGLLPAGTQRGLLLVDPPYVEATDCDALLALLGDVRNRWPSGTLAAWYPRRGDGIGTKVREGMRNRGRCAACDCWIERPSTGSRGMQGCGVVVINPPPGFTRDWEPIGAWLATRLFEGSAGRSGVAALDRNQA